MAEKRAYKAVAERNIKFPASNLPADFLTEWKPERWDIGLFGVSDHGL